MTEPQSVDSEMLSLVDVEKVWRCETCIGFREMAKKYLNVIILAETMVKLHNEEGHGSEESAVK
jgi:hypothetical protein